MDTTKTKLSKKEIRKLNWRWILLGQACPNYGRMQGLGYLTTMLPVIKKLYHGDSVAEKEAFRVQSQFFNTTPHMAHIIMGVDLALEENKGSSSLTAIEGLKTSLMGPFAGIGDALFPIIGNTIIMSIAASMAVDGNYFGIVLAEIVLLSILLFLRPWFFKLGYSQGTTLLKTAGDRLTKISSAVSVLGLIVVGAMIASMVQINFNAVKIFGSTIELQSGFFDKIMPKLPQALLAAGCYWLAGRKKMTTTRLIVIVILIALGLSAAGVLIPEPFVAGK